MSAWNTLTNSTTAQPAVVLWLDADWTHPEVLKVDGNELWDFPSVDVVNHKGALNARDHRSGADGRCEKAWRAARSAEVEACDAGSLVPYGRKHLAVHAEDPCVEKRNVQVPAYFRDSDPGSDVVDAAESHVSSLDQILRPLDSDCGLML